MTKNEKTINNQIVEEEQDKAWKELTLTNGKRLRSCQAMVFESKIIEKR